MRKASPTVYISGICAAGTVMPSGRPTKLTPEIQTNIVAAIQHGAYIETAAAMAGIVKSTFYDWLKKGAELSDKRESGKPIIKKSNLALIEFSNAIKRAVAQAEFRDVRVIDEAAQAGVWQAAAWRLERKHHGRWGRKLALTDSDGGSLAENAAAAWAKALNAPPKYDPSQLPKRVNGSGNGTIIDQTPE